MIVPLYISKEADGQWLTSTEDVPPPRLMAHLPEEDRKAVLDSP